jgi:hypothetical protein
MLLEDFIANVDREDTCNFTETIGNGSLHVISNENGITVLNIAASKELIVKSTMFSYRNDKVIPLVN